MSVLTASDVIVLAEIVGAASQSASVVFATDDGEIVRGTARHIVVSPDNFGFVGSDTDIRDGYLRTTMESGLERTDKVSDLMDMRRAGTFAIGI